MQSPAPDATQFSEMPLDDWPLVWIDFFLFFFRFFFEMPITHPSFFDRS